MDCLKNYTVVNGVYYFFQLFSLFSAKLRISICEVSEMTSLSMTSLRLNLSEFAKCVRAADAAHTLYKIPNGDDVWPSL